jgi:deazaflavin-dependent oxidoreductase (nitroreductase family)
MTLPDDIKAYNRQLIEEFRANGGTPGRSLLLLTTTGRRSGQAVTTPMMFIPDGERLLVVASNAGAPRHPDWFHNLVAHPRVRVEVTGDTFDAVASVPEGEEHDRLFAGIVEQYPFFADHQAKVSRVIPVVVLTRD